MRAMPAVLRGRMRGIVAIFYGMDASMRGAEMMRMMAVMRY
jgi:hypothetical protein